MIKCVIWDLDNTLLDGVYLESPGQPPPADPAMTRVLDTLSGRGIIHAIATRNPPEAAEHAAAAAGHQFAAAQCGWGRKSDAIRQIADDLGLATSALAFVDDEPYERAEVGFALPELLVLSPEDMADAAGWPQFGSAAVTAEARQRGASYAQRRARQQQEAAFGGSRADFLRYCGTSIVIEAAELADVPRLHELSVRTRQFNSAGDQVSEAALAALIGAAGRRVITVRLSDRYGDDGLVGACVIATGGPAAGGPVTDSRSDGGPVADSPVTGSPAGGAAPEWTVTLLMMSCRAIGRGVIDALLAWLTRVAAANGAPVLTVPCRLSPRNVPLRLALAGAGFRAVGLPAAGPGEPGESGESPSATFARPLAEAVPAEAGLAEGGLAGGGLPELPSWVSAPQR